MAALRRVSSRFFACVPFTFALLAVLAAPATAQFEDETPPTITVSPGSGIVTTSSLSVTIDWCDNLTLNADSRLITLNGTNVTGSFTYTSVGGPCGVNKRSTATITLQPGPNTLGAYICDNAEQCETGGAEYTYTVVHVTPDNQNVTNAQHASGITKKFAVQNLTGSSATFDLTGVCTGATSSCSVQSSVTLGGLATDSVAVSYSTAAVGSGTVKLRAALSTNAALKDSGWVNVSVQQSIVVSTAFTNQDNQNVALCANACFAVTHAQSTVPYFSLDRPRSVTLVYHGDRVAVRPFVYADVSLVTGGTPPDYYEFQVKDSLTAAFLPFVNGDATKHVFAPGSGAPIRLGGQVDMSAYGTSIRPIQVIVTAVRAGYNEQATTNGRLLIVNERKSPVARGWTIAGLQRLHPQANGALVTEGDGSAAYFHAGCSAPCTYTAPEGEYSRLQTLNSGGTVTYLRSYIDSTKAWFGTAGLLDSIADSFGNKTKFTYDGSNRLIRVYDPIRTDTTGAAQYIKLTYGAYGITEIEEPGPGRATSGGRITRLTVESDSTLRVFEDPDTTSTRFAYDASRRLERVINRRGDTTRFVYDTLFSWKLIKLILPRVAIDAGSGATTDSTPIVLYRPWQLAPLPVAATSTASKATPAALDSVTGKATDPTGFVATILVDRWGQPLRIADPVGRMTTITRAGVLPTVIRSPTGAEHKIGYFSFAGSPNPAWTKPAGQDTTYFDYGAYGRVTQISGPGQATQTFYVGTGGRIDSTKIGSNNYKTRYQYDSRGRVTLMADPGADTTRYGYDARFGNLDSTLAPGNRYTKVRLDGYGRDSVSLAAGRSAAVILYDILNRVKETRDSVNASPTTLTYDRLYLTRVRDPQGQVHRFEINSLGWKTREYDPADTLNRYMAYRYSPAGRLTSQTNRRSQRVDMKYDGVGRLISKRGPTNVVADTFSYVTDANGERVLALNAVSRDSIFVSALGWTDSVVSRLATDSTKRFRIYYKPDQQQRLDSIGFATNAGITFSARRFSWNSGTGLLDGISLDQVAGGATFGRGDEGQRQTTTWNNSLVRTEYYTRLHQPSTVSYNNSTVNTAMWRSYSYDSLARMTEIGRKDGSGYKFKLFGYTGLSQLRLVEDATLASATSTCPGTEVLDDYGNECRLEQQLVSQQLYQFSYDSLGNLKKEKNVTANDSTLGIYVTGNRLTQWGVTPYAYDLDGNLQRRRSGSDSVRYHWSADGLLDSVTTAGLRMHYEYNALGRLVRVRRDGSTQRHYLWDGAQLLSELSSSLSARVAEYAYYPGIDRPFALITGAQSIAAARFFHRDAAGNVVAISTTNSLAQQIDYEVWGLVSSVSGTLADTNRLRWKGYLWEADSTNLYYARNRWYDPAGRRFVNEDPLRLGGGLNLYAFAKADPVNGSDPFGLDDDPCPEGSSKATELVDAETGDVWYECEKHDGSGSFVIVIPRLPTVNVPPDEIAPPISIYEPKDWFTVGPSFTAGRSTNSWECGSVSMSCGSGGTVFQQTPQFGGGINFTVRDPNNPLPDTWGACSGPVSHLGVCVGYNNLKWSSVTVQLGFGTPTPPLTAYFAGQPSTAAIIAARLGDRVSPSNRPMR